MDVVGLLLAGIMGIALGLFGGGGSILTVPILVYAMGFGAKESIAMSLAVVGLTSLVGAVVHWRAGNVDVRLASIFGVVAMAGTYGGARLAAWVSGTTQLALFAIVMVGAAIFMLRDRRPEEDPNAGGVQIPSRLAPTGLIVLEGAGVGVLTGLVGVGGGFLIVPALVLLAKVPIRIAIGTSLAIISLKSGAGLAGYLGQVAIPWLFVAKFSAVAILGAWGGTYLQRLVSPGGLKKGFAILLLIMGFWILWQNRPSAAVEAVAQDPIEQMKMSAKEIYDDSEALL